METPSNIMTPTHFADVVADKLSSREQVSVVVRNKKWAEDMKMGSFLAVGRGSEEPSVFLEVTYKGSETKDAKPFILVGKGVTFDTGGISLKPSANMHEMRGDMGGGACVAATMLAISKLQLPINVKALIPLCENMPSGRAIKPGDVVTAMNGKSIQIDNTDAEGRLILADALCYADTFKPSGILDMATLTGAMRISLGAGATGTFTTSSMMWDHLHKAGGVTGDRVWRMPLFSLYSKQIEAHLADVNNIGKHGAAGGACVAAAFLKEFVKCSNWAHLDIAGVMDNKDEVPYLGKGMTGRPTRTIVEFLSRIAANPLT